MQRKTCIFQSNSSDTVSANLYTILHTLSYMQLQFKRRKKLQPEQREKKLLLKKLKRDCHDFTQTFIVLIIVLQFWFFFIVCNYLLQTIKIVPVTVSGFVASFVFDHFLVVVVVPHVSIENYYNAFVRKCIRRGNG